MGGEGPRFPYQIVNKVKNMSRNRQILLDDETTSAENQAPQAWVLAPGRQVRSALLPAPQLLAQLQHNDQHSVPQLPAVMEPLRHETPLNKNAEDQRVPRYHPYRRATTPHRLHQPMLGDGHSHYPYTSLRWNINPPGRYTLADAEHDDEIQQTWRRTYQEEYYSQRYGRRAPLWWRWWRYLVPLP